PGILVLERFGRLPLARGLEGFVRVAGANRERPWLRGRLGTMGACRTSRAICPCKPHMDDGMRMAVVPRDPRYTPAPVGTGDGVRIPVHHERGHIAPLRRFRLPARVRVHWSQ